MTEETVIQNEEYKHPATVIFKDEERTKWLLAYAADKGRSLASIIREATYDHIDRLRKEGPL